MSSLWIVLGLLALPPVLVAAVLTGLYFYLMRYYSPYLMRIFLEKPLFIIPRGQPVAGAETVSLQTADGRRLTGCYLRTPAERRGVVLFGLEFGSNRWACVPYCQHLLDNGYDVFTYEPRNQGESEVHPGYVPLQWLTRYDQVDAAAAIAYLKSRPDRDPRGIGFFGVSKGGGAGVIAGADDPFVRCFVTDGMFGTWSTVVPYMRKWISIYSKQYFLQRIAPAWYYELIARRTIPLIQRAHGYHFISLEKAMPRLAPRPLLMIHGGGDTYIKPDMARTVFDRAHEPKEFWLVPGAKHNQGINVAADEYRRRVLEFFDRHLGHPRNAVPPHPASDAAAPAASSPREMSVPVRGESPVPVG